MCIFDVFKAHQTRDVLQKLKDNKIGYVFVPVNCTDQLQLFDLTVSKVYKAKFASSIYGVVLREGRTLTQIWRIGIGDSTYWLENQF